MVPAVVPESERAAHLAAARERLAGGFPHAAERAATIERGFPVAERMQVYREAARAATLAQKIHWLRVGADRTLAAAAGVSACARGCAHCCHTPVLVSATEADWIGREIGRPPVAGDEIADSAPAPGPRADANDAALQAVTALHARLAARHTGTPCTFLSAAGECTIYASRPLACRRVINLDDDALLCRIVPGHPFGPSYLDQRIEQLLDLQAAGRGVQLADLRDWFP